MLKITNLNNDDAGFDQPILDTLQCYVYVLRDPRDRKIFYVGKGGGDGDGNQRVLGHFNEAENALKNPSLERSQKVQRIIEIWSADEIVEWFIVRYGLDLATALHIEAALIDGYEISQNGPTLNLVGGHGRSAHGILSSEDIYALQAAKVNPNNSYDLVFIFPIKNTLQEGRTVYDATRSYWSVSQSLRNQKGALAIGLSNGISKGVFTVDGWNNTGLPPKKWEFFSIPALPLKNHELDNKNWLAIIRAAMGFWQRGQYLVVEFNGKGEFRFIRGNINKNDWLSL